MRIIVVTPARNEEQFIEDTILSVQNQTLQPAAYVVVDDGSVDGTTQIVQRFKWVRLLSLRNRGYRYRGAGVATAVNRGFEEAESRVPDWDFFCKLDADIILPPNYFEKLTAIMTAPSNKRLGIASGVVKGEKTNLEHPRGAARFYRRQCWEDIGGRLAEIHGWDTYSDLRARQFRWYTRGIQDLQVIQQRPTAGREHHLSVAFQLGRIMYILGYHPLVAYSRALKLITKNPLASLVMALSYTVVRMDSQYRILPSEYYEYVHIEQKQRIRDVIRKLRLK